MRIIAIDPGYERLGIAVIEKDTKKTGIRGTKETLLFSECFKTNPKLPHFERLGLIGGEISRIITEWGPGAMCLETLFFSVNQKTVMTVAEARGVILFQASKHGLQVYEYGPGQIKLAVTGYGKSDKSAMMDMIPRLITINKEIAHDDEYDAIAVGLTCFAIERF